MSRDLPGDMAVGGEAVFLSIVILYKPFCMDYMVDCFEGVVLSSGISMAWHGETLSIVLERQLWRALMSWGRIGRVLCALMGMGV